MKWLCEAAVCAGKVYCEADYLKSVAPKCSKCLQPVAGESISMGKRVFHPKCLKCTTCRYITMVTVFHAAASVPLHQCTTVSLPLCCCPCIATTMLLCTTMSLPLVSPPLCCPAPLSVALCLKYNSCSCPLAGVEATEKNGALYCVPCFTNNFASNYHKCKLPIDGACVNALKHDYHQACFGCHKVSGINSSHCLSLSRSRTVSVCLAFTLSRSRTVSVCLAFTLSHSRTISVYLALATS